MNGCCDGLDRLEWIGLDWDALNSKDGWDWLGRINIRPLDWVGFLCISGSMKWIFRIVNFFGGGLEQDVCNDFGRNDLNICIVPQFVIESKILRPKYNTK